MWYTERIPFTKMSGRMPSARPEPRTQDPICKISIVVWSRPFFLIFSRNCTKDRGPIKVSYAALACLFWPDPDPRVYKLIS
jgi:hypothetical protein